MNFAIDKFDKDRFGLVTGSKCTVLFPLKGDGKVGQRTYAKTLANEKFFKTYDEVTNWQMEHGSLCEPSALEFYHDYYDKNIEAGEWRRKGECGGTIDAIVKGSHGVDFKCPTSLNKWLDYIYEPLDKQQSDQCQMYMWLENLPHWEIAAFLEETQFMSNNGLTYPVPRNKRMIRVRVDRDPTWAERLQDPLKYVVSERDKYLEILKETFGQLQLEAQ